MARTTTAAPVLKGEGFAGAEKSGDPAVARSPKLSVTALDALTCPPLADGDAGPGPPQLGQRGAVAEIWRPQASQLTRATSLPPLRCRRLGHGASINSFAYYATGTSRLTGGILA